jgi:hypothetical protein
MYMTKMVTPVRSNTFIVCDSIMSLIDHTTLNVESPAERHADGGFSPASNFRFVPKELAAKCRKLIESYHAMHGYGCLPDMLWHSDARDIIECHRELMQVFKNASKSRGAKRAYESFLLIATAVVSLEVLVRDFAGWGRRFPAAKREADAMLVDFPTQPRAWFMDKYLYPSLNTHRELASALAPSTAKPVAFQN